ncbi:MAG: DUF2490 domain-containing protein [Chitinophagaceae bacterium]|nr:DUF2490 domain-containing protein [Chitinophagaceae bacterium]
MKKFLPSLLLILQFVFTNTVTAQLPPKEVNRQTQTWLGIISQVKLNPHWSILADLHIRRNHFVQDPNFVFMRLALARQITKQFQVAAGYGHMWLSPTREGWKTISNEHRFYQQLLFSGKFHRLSIQHRLRNEQRWQQKTANDVRTGDYRFTNRIRYQLALSIPVSSKNDWPQFVLSDELAVHFGKEVIYNHFDQNRVFIGLKQKLSNHLSADFGYMRVYQKKYSGYQYDLNDTFRCFIYVTGGPKAKSQK